ncbi:hypothetical protein HYV72_01930, partial [Candidatus Uhrbacteria bacterium]|nr:hypothetical protein [Candidatus Uhrbacteria bacterium]
MLSSQEKRGFVVAIIVLGLLAIALVLWLLFFRGASRDGRLTPIPEEERPSQEVVEEETPLPAVITPAAAHVRTVSINFTERFGT